MSTPEGVSVLYTANQIARRVAELGREISHDYAERELCLVSVLSGALFFTSDLARQLDLPLTLEFITVSSYKGGTRPQTKPQLRFASELAIKGRHVLIVEDIVDTGHTVDLARRVLEEHSPQTIGVCTLLNKPAGRQVEVSLDYVGFEVPERFIVGYGLDHASRFRNLPWLGQRDI